MNHSKDPHLQSKSVQVIFQWYYCHTISKQSHLKHNHLTCIRSSGDIPAILKIETSNNTLLPVTMVLPRTN